MDDDGELLCRYSTVSYIIETSRIDGHFWTVTMSVLGSIDDNGTIDRLGEIMDS